MHSIKNHKNYMLTNSAINEQHLCPSSDPANSVGRAISFHSGISGSSHQVGLLQRRN